MTRVLSSSSSGLGARMEKGQNTTDYLDNLIKKLQRVDQKVTDS